MTAHHEASRPQPVFAIGQTQPTRLSPLTPFGRFVLPVTKPSHFRNSSLAQLHQCSSAVPHPYLSSLNIKPAIGKLLDLFSKRPWPTSGQQQNKIDPARRKVNNRCDHRDTHAEYHYSLLDTTMDDSENLGAHASQLPQPVRYIPTSPQKCLNEITSSANNARAGTMLPPPPFGGLKRHASACKKRMLLRIIRLLIRSSTRTSAEA